MKNHFAHFVSATLLMMGLISCGTPKSGNLPLPHLSPEESGLSLEKITDESSSIIAGQETGYRSTQKAYNEGICVSASFGWATDRLLDISPDGTEIAFLAVLNNQYNIMVRRTDIQNTTTQRTFRNVGDFSWGSDGKLYFGDAINWKRVQISSTDAHTGTLMRQLTNNSMDCNPVLSNDGEVLYFTRIDQTGTYIWSYNVDSGALTLCSRGYNPCPIGEGSEEFLCVRNSSSGTSEIWRVNYKLGIETLVLADKNRGFTNPRISPDGQWILCQGNSKSSITKKNNLDLFVVRTNGTDFIQLTYHPADDCCPVWSADGKFIYFISSRATEKEAYNIWKMKFDL